MTAKSYLRQIKWNEIKIEQKKFQLRGISENIDYMHAIDYSHEKVQTSPRDVLAESITKIADLKQEILNDIAELEALRNSAINQIQTMRDARFAQILFLRYVKGKEFLHIANELEYDYSYLRSLHGKALRAFEEQFLRD